MDTKDKLIERQKELLDIFEDWLEIDYDEGGYQKIRRLKSEIVAFEQQVEEQKSTSVKGTPSFTENINRTIISQLEQKILELIKNSEERESQFIKFANKNK